MGLNGAKDARQIKSNYLAEIRHLSPEHHTPFYLF